MEIDELSRNISNHELKHIVGIEERFILLQNELTQAKTFQREQKDCAEVKEKLILIKLDIYIVYIIFLVFK